MLRFLKSLSRTVHEERCSQDPEPPNNDGGNHSVNSDGPTSLTVWRKSLFVGCSGFTVINSDGDLVYRVDNYGGRRQQQVVLMDASGKPILTISRTKKLNLADNWLVFEGDISSKKQKPIYHAKKDTDFLRTKVKRLARVNRYDENLEYMIEGSYANRSCEIIDESGSVVAEIRRKESNAKGVSLGLDVFDLVVNQGFDSSLAMSIVLLLDQMFL